MAGMRASPMGERIMQRLSELDRDRGWLARQVGRDLSTIHRWISGERTLSERDLRDISLVLHRPVEWFVGSGTATATATEDVAAA
jgi:hypothetical protein